MRVGFRKVAFEDAVRAFIFDHEREMRGVMESGVLNRGKRSDENGEGIGLHGFDEDRAIGDLIEFGCVHGTMFSMCKFIVASLPGLKIETWGTQFLSGHTSQGRRRDQSVRS